MSLISNVYSYKFFIEPLGCLCSKEEVGRMPRRCAATKIECAIVNHNYRNIIIPTNNQDLIEKKHTNHTQLTPRFLFLKHLVRVSSGKAKNSAIRRAIFQSIRLDRNRLIARNESFIIWFPFFYLFVVNTIFKLGSHLTSKTFHFSFKLIAQELFLELPLEIFKHMNVNWENFPQNRI